MTHEQRAKIDAMLRARPVRRPSSIREQRDLYTAQLSERSVPEGIRTSEVQLGGLRTLLVEPPGASAPGAMLFFHGGAFMVGTPEDELCLTGNLVVRTALCAYSPEYRLAPEHPFPAAVDDGLAAYRALLESGADPAATVVAGDSAGGALAVTTLLTARSAGLPMPAAIALFSPALDATLSGASMTVKEGIDPNFTRERLAGV